MYITSSAILFFCHLSCKLADPKGCNYLTNFDSASHITGLRGY